jgi:RNA polymerase sigma factor (sigma-70 family)
VDSQTDSELLKAYAERRCEAAFTELVGRHIDFVYSAARRMVRDAQVAEDVTQGVFMALAKNAAQLTNRPVLAAWLHRTAQNIASQTIRTDVRRRTREQMAAFMSESFATESEPLWEQTAPFLDRAVDGLRDQDREAILLRYFERKTAREIGQIFGTSEEAAHKRVSRAVERLRLILGKQGVTAGAAGLVTAISVNAVQAAPVGLETVISSTVTAAGATVTTTASAITKTIAMTTLHKALIVTAVAAVVATPLILEHQRVVTLRQENSALLEQKEQFAALPEENKRLSNLLAQISNLPTQPTNQDRELLKLRGEVGVLRQQTNELHNLQAENLRLRFRLATNESAVPTTPKDSWAFVGYANPEAAFQSAFWSMNQGNSAALLASLAPGGREFQKVQSLSSDAYLKKRKDQFDTVTAFKILDRELVSPDEAILTVYLEGAKQAERFRLQRFDNEWKLDGPYREDKTASPPSQP